MTLTRDTYVKPASEEIVDADVSDETIVYDPASVKYASMNASASFIWRRIGSGTTMGALVDAVSSEFGVGTEQAEADVALLLEDLIDGGILVAE